MREITLIAFLFTNLYSPFSAYTAVVLNILIALSVAINKNLKIELSDLSRFLIVLSLIIFLWTFLISLINWTFSPYVLGRFARILFNTTLIAIVIENKKVNIEKLITSLIFVLLLNTLAVYIQTIIPSTKTIFAPIANYQKSFFAIRSFGLFAAYDATGLCSCITMIILALRYNGENKLKYIFAYLAVLISTVFVSRTSMAIAIVITIYFSFGFVKTLRWKLIYFAPFAAMALYYFYINAAKIFISTFISQNQEIGSSYYAGSQDKLINEMIFFPDTLQGLLMGLAIEPKNSDIGYVKLIFMIGLIGLLLILAFYTFIHKYLRKRHRSSIPTSNSEKKILYTFVSIMPLLMLLFNFKLLLLYGRGFHDLYIISLLAIYGTTRIKEKYYSE